MHTCMNKQTYTHMNIYNMHNLTNAYERAYMHMYKHFMHVHNTYACMFIHVHTNTYTHIHLYSQTHTEADK